MVCAAFVAYGHHFLLISSTFPTLLPLVFHPFSYTPSSLQHYFAAFLNRDQAFNRLVSFWRNSQQENPLDADELLGIDESFPFESDSVFSDDEVSASTDLARRERSQSLQMEPSSATSSVTSSASRNLAGTPTAASSSFSAAERDADAPSTPARSRATSRTDDAKSPPATPAGAAATPAAVSAAISAAVSAPDTPTSATLATQEAVVAVPDKAVEPKDVGYAPLKTPVLDVVLPAPIGVVYEKLFDPSLPFFATFLRENQRLTGAQIVVF